MRIGGGRARGTRLRAKGGRGVRPTSTLVSDAVFNSLAPRIAGACVLDLFAGTGRLGIEALSRGAREAVFVERDPRNAALIRQNRDRGRSLAGRPGRDRRPGARADRPVRRDRRLGLRARRREGGRRLRENTLAIALYPGSFDPVHNGHLDIIERARRMARRVVVGVASNVEKEPMFSIADRVAMLRAATERAGVEVMSFGGLTVDFAHRLGATVIVKGLRAMMDFEYELKMAAMNKRLRPDIETIFMMTAPARSVGRGGALGPAPPAGGAVRRRQARRRRRGGGDDPAPRPGRGQADRPGGGRPRPQGARGRNARPRGRAADPAAPGAGRP